MGRTLGRVVAGVVGLVLVALLVSWVWPPSAAQQRALAALRAPHDLPGSNAYVTLATLEMQAPLVHRQAQVDEHARRFQAWYDDSYAPGFIRGDAESEAGVPPPLPMDGAARTPTADPALCGFRDAATCLERVRRAPEAVAAALATRATLLSRMDELAAHGHYRSPLVQAPPGPWPVLGPLAVPLGAHALAHVQGDSARALAGLCRDAGSGRMLMAHGDNLLATMMGIAMLRANAELFAAVLAELPADAPLPSGCATAFAPLSADEAAVCNGMRGEFAMQQRFALLMDRKIEAGPRSGRLFYNGRKTLARQAEALAWSCLPAARQAVAEDRRAPLPSLPAVAWWQPQCLTNAIGCILSDIAGPAYTGYLYREQDAAAQLRLLQAVLWMRGQALQDTEAVSARLRELPAGLRSAHRPITLSADGTALETPAYARQGQVLRMPLPLAASSP
ncbi:hypothetical protein EM864_05055 [Stenotrophomonas acidaminiphila]|uniref:hypothetical protein n=1 Tax=Stenotrophomonas acidaminiphila TaxID=128780 RepID=UPI002405BE9D|nr:hypothetical protein [Stenotrophomonas acidaminiphila]MDF9441122.1 hypothetical protein [Stenotrophomonas acidaminiphila]